MEEMQMRISAAEVAAANTAQFPGESELYRAARNALLAEEIELRRQMERVAALRRALPPGGILPRDFSLTGEAGEVRFSQLFGEQDTLLVYSMMYGRERRAPRAMCTSFLKSWNGTARNLRTRVSMAVTARSPIQRLAGFKEGFGLKNLSFFSDESGAYTRTYVSPEDNDMPGFSVFTRVNGTVRHRYSSEMSFALADPDRDPLNAPDLDAMWLMLDTTPDGHGPANPQPDDLKRP